MGIDFIRLIRIHENDKINRWPVSQLFAILNVYHAGKKIESCWFEILDAAVGQNDGDCYLALAWPSQTPYRPFRCQVRNTGCLQAFLRRRSRQRWKHQTRLMSEHECRNDSRGPGQRKAMTSKARATHEPDLILIQKHDNAQRAKESSTRRLTIPKSLL